MPSGCLKPPMKRILKVEGCSEFQLQVCDEVMKERVKDDELWDEGRGKR